MERGARSRRAEKGGGRSVCASGEKAAFESIWPRANAIYSVRVSGALSCIVFTAARREAAVLQCAQAGGAPSFDPARCEFGGRS